MLLMLITLTFLYQLYYFIFCFILYFILRLSSGIFNKLKLRDKIPIIPRIEEILEIKMSPQSCAESDKVMNSGYCYDVCEYGIK